MKESLINAVWIEQARVLLDQSTQSFDAATLSRLNRARQTALAQRQRAQPWWTLGGAWAVAGAGALALMLVLIQGPMRMPWLTPLGIPSTAQLETVSDAEMLADNDNFELYEDLEFYAWLDAQAQDGHG